MKNTVEIKKVAAGSNNFGFYNRSSMLARRSAAKWGVVVGGKVVARIVKITGEWTLVDLNSKVLFHHDSKDRVIAEAQSLFGE